MKFWPAEPLSLEIIDNSSSEGKVVYLDRPFGLIGSHKHCDFRIAESSAPDVVYALFSLPGRVEVWPLGRVAFPVWGPISVDTEFSVGKTQLRLISSPERGQILQSDSSFTWSTDNEKVLKIRHGKKKRSILINRQASIVGSAHPSVIRLQGAKLASCALAVVCFDQGCWLLRLDIDSRQTGESRSNFVAEGEQTVIGNLSIGYQVRPKSDESSAHYESGILSHGEDDGEDSSKNLLTREPRGKLPENSRLSPELDITPDQITDRLASIQRQRTQWFSIGKKLATFALIVCATGVVVWALSVLVPKVIKIYGLDTP
jgi:hypothetical protein